MRKYFVVHESTEDSFEPTSDLEDAIRLAREVASQGQQGDPVSVLDDGGLAVRQFVRMPDGAVREQPVVSRAER